MRNLALCLTLLLCAGSTAIGADNQRIESKVGLRARTFKVGDVWCMLPQSELMLPPPELPSTAEVLRAISEDKVVRKNPRVKCEVIVSKLELPREYPLVGLRQMQKIHFK